MNQEIESRHSAQPFGVRRLLKASASVALTLALMGAAPSFASSSAINNPGFLSLSASKKLEKLLKCDVVYRLISDPNRAAKMNGFYCVTGLNANFRVVKIFNSTKAAQEDTDLYVPIQTGGRKVYLGKNWFVFGLPNDLKAVLGSKLILKSQAGLGLTDYTNKQDLCMSLSTAALQSHFNDLASEKQHFHDLDWLFKGVSKYVKTAISRYGAQLSKSLLSNNSFPGDQDLAQASLTYKPFCLSQKGEKFDLG